MKLKQKYPLSRIYHNIIKNFVQNSQCNNNFYVPYDISIMRKHLFECQRKGNNKNPMTWCFLMSAAFQFATFVFLERESDK